VRWEHPQRGLIPPDRFIPLAEYTGLIGPLTRYVLDTALRHAA
jgi:EAL domain-containing protein (putative c-di-GMP-specific phosphodiesterase class I)